ncbi:MAG TPA: ABC transporter permease, partial [bacterium]|nr:ABC transporter permease [bacterium]
MGAYLLRRLLQSVVILLGITLITFALLFLLPADPARMIAGRSATTETVMQIRAELGLNESLPVQYVRYLSRLARGDLGRSYAQKIEVTELLSSRIGATFLL